MSKDGRRQVEASGIRKPEAGPEERVRTEERRTCPPRCARRAARAPRARLRVTLCCWCCRCFFFWARRPPPAARHSRAAVRGPSRCGRATAARPAASPQAVPTARPVGGAPGQPGPARLPGLPRAGPRPRGRAHGFAGPPPLSRAWARLSLALRRAPLGGPPIVAARPSSRSAA